jgi:hypothetical protein
MDPLESLRQHAGSDLKVGCERSITFSFVEELWHVKRVVHVQGMQKTDVHHWRP